MNYENESELFDEIIEEQLKAIKETLLVKGKEYRRFGNPFHNFDRGVAITGKTREEIIWGFALKHFVSIQDLKEDIKNGKEVSKDVLDEKYGDLLIYLLIEKASILINNKNK